MHIGEIIKRYRKEHKMSMAEFAKQANISKAYVSVLEKNKDPRNGNPITPSIPTIKNVAQGINMDFDDLFRMLDDNQIVKFNDTPTTLLDLITSTAAELTQPRQEKVLDFTTEQLDEQRKEFLIQETSATYLTLVSVYEKLAAASSLENGYSYDGMEIAKVYTDKDSIKNYDLASFVDGDSMVPTYKDGDVVLIRQGFDNVNGGVYAVDYNGKSYLKKVYIEENRFRLVSINDNYEDIFIDIPVDESIYFNIIGKVVDSFTPVEV